MTAQRITTAAELVGACVGWRVVDGLTAADDEAGRVVSVDRDGITIDAVPTIDGRGFQGRCPGPDENAATGVRPVGQHQFADAPVRAPAPGYGYTATAHPSTR